MLVSLIPNGEFAIIIEKDSKTINSQSLFFNATNLYGKKHGISISKSIGNGLRLGMERIIVDEICGKEANLLFHSMDFGSSFLTTIKGNFSGRALATTLLSKPTSVEAARLSCMDVSVSIDKNNALSVYEYSWLSRGEIEDGIDINGKDLLDFKEVMFDSKESLSKSKIIGLYSNMTGFSIEQSVQKLGITDCQVIQS